MNLISNCCIGGFLYKNEFKCEFENPFIWCSIYFNDYIMLMENYNTINWNNLSMDKCSDGGYTLIIDKKVKINYIHYKFDAKYKTPVHKGVDTIYCRIWEYIVDKYKLRLNRMLTNNEEPIWIIKDTFWNFTSENCRLILEKFKDKKIILCTKDKSLNMYESENIKILLDKDPRIPSKPGANQYLSKFIYTNCFTN